MFDMRNYPIVRPAITIVAQDTCPIASGDEGIWRDSSDGAVKHRNADGTDTVMGNPGQAQVIAVDAVATAALAANTYANGTSGVGATLTANANGALGTIDGVTMSVGKILLVAGEATKANNGVYKVTTAGGASAKYVLTRLGIFDTSAEIVPGTIIDVKGGTNFAMTTWKYTGGAAPVVGTDNLTFAIAPAQTVLAAAEQISAAGALSVIIRTTVLSVASTKAYTLADGLFIGQRKTIFCRSATSTPVGTVTPAHPSNFATLTFSNANAFAELEWNGTGWDLVGIGGTVTVA